MRNDHDSYRVHPQIGELWMDKYNGYYLVLQKDRDHYRILELRTGKLSTEHIKIWNLLKPQLFRA